MGLTKSSTGIKAVDEFTVVKKRSESEKIIALAGNPNVGKSTIFNALTGLNQHTGNWPGKTVANALGTCQSKCCQYTLVDIPGTYSLMAHSAEEEIARNFICFNNPDAVVVVCDATCLERNLNLVLQAMEISDKVIICINLMDEAKRKKIDIDTKTLSDTLHVPVVSTVARKKKTLRNLLDAIDDTVLNKKSDAQFRITYPTEIESAISVIEKAVKEKIGDSINARWLSIKLLENDELLMKELNKRFGEELLTSEDLRAAIYTAHEHLAAVQSDSFKDIIASTVITTAEGIADKAVKYNYDNYSSLDRRLDKFLTGKIWGFPAMIMMLALIFWITVTGANYPSEILSKFLFNIQDKLTELFIRLNAPKWLHGILVLGMYRVLAWVTAVMLPPMAIFFPLFTVLEDSGYLPRIAYNLDKPFKKCCACGKQALTMCMGFGCNAAGIVGCRIIDSPRERLLAILTNNFVPCNGRFPTLISIISMFLIFKNGKCTSIISSLILTFFIVGGIFLTFAVTNLLSKTLLNGIPSSFTLELPPYRIPQFGKIIVHSIFDRTIFVLGRAAAVAAPAGMIIWLMANIYIHGANILNICANFLNPFASLMGLDGVILIAFVLGFPANEIVIPIIIMAYMSSGTITEFDSLNELKSLFVENGWTTVTAVCTMIFSLFHWPCSTTLLTIKKETGSLKWTALAAAIPTLCGIIICMLINLISKIFI